MSGMSDVCCRMWPTSIASFSPCQPGRRELLQIRFEQTLSAGELSERVELSRPAVAEHLKVRVTRGWWPIGRTDAIASIV